MKFECSPTVLIKLGIAGYIFRILIWSLSLGSNDIRIWHNFAYLIREYGVLYVYGLNLDPIFNHPPLMGLFSALCLSFADTLGIPFSYIFRIAPMLSDMGTGVLIYIYIEKSRKSPHIAAWGFLIYSWSVPSILIANFHGNTDAICIFLLVGSVVVWDIYRKFAWSLMLLFASINVKIIPLILIPATALNCRKLRIILVGSLISLTALAPFIIGFIYSHDAMYKNIFQYKSYPEPWGINFLILITGKYQVSNIFTAYIDRSSGIIIIAIIMASIFIHYVKKNNYLESVLVIFIIFFILAPGFAVQYFIYLSPLVLMYSIKYGLIYSLLAGLSCLLIYIPFTKTLLPWETLHTFPFPLQAIYACFATWLFLVYVIYKVLKYNNKVTKQ